MVFFGPPGTGKTTVANIIAKESNMQLFMLNATTASISDIKEVIESTCWTFCGGGGRIRTIEAKRSRFTVC